MSRAFIIYLWFIFYFYFFSVGNQMQTSPRPTLNHTICYVYSPTLLKNKYMDDVMDIVLLCVKYIFVWFY